MRLFILGATGRTGRALVGQALARGHNVTAFVRAPEKLEEFQGRVVVRKGDARSVEELQVALSGHDAVLSVLGPPGIGESTILSDAARTTVQAMRAAGVRRLLVVSVGLLFDDAGALATMLRRTLLRNIARDSAEMERIVMSSGLEWTVARPPRLTNAPLTGSYVVADGRLPTGSRRSTSRADIANFLLDEVERPAHVQRIVGLSTPSGRGRALAYWVATSILATECIVGGALGALRWPPYTEIMRHLGYPVYLMTILGLWYALAGVALVAPRFPRLKEWAYAGLVFNYTGAAASHLAVGDGTGALAAPIVFTGLTVVSWALRPLDRRDLAPS